MFFDIIFSKIANSVYEPIFFTGILAPIFIGLKRRKTTLNIFIFAVIFMIAWRILFQIKSSRYSIILFYPFSIGSAYVCIKLSILFKRLELANVLRIQVIIPFILLSIYIIGSTLYLLSPRPYRNTMQKASYFITHARKIHPHIFSNSIEDMDRLEFYTGYSIVPFFNDKTKELLTIKECIEPDITYYFYMQEKTNIDSFSKRLPSNIIQKNLLKCIFSQYVNKKKKYRDNVFIYTNNNQLHVLGSLMPQAKDGDLLKNGIFKPLSQTDANKKTARWKKKGFDYYATNDFKYPEGGYFSMDPEPDGNHMEYPKMSLISGDHFNFIRIKTNRIAGLWVFQESFPLARYFISARVKGTPGSEIVLFINISKNNQWIENRKIVRYIFSGEQKGPIELIGYIQTPSEMFSQNTDLSFHPALYILNGSTEISQISLCPAE